MDYREFKEKTGVSQDITDVLEKNGFKTDALETTHDYVAEVDVAKAAISYDDWVITFGFEINFPLWRDTDKSLIKAIDNLVFRGLNGYLEENEPHDEGELLFDDKELEYIDEKMHALMTDLVAAYKAKHHGPGYVISPRKRCSCGCGRFRNKQVIEVTGEVDKDGKFNVSYTPVSHSDEEPDGPFECVNCGREYDTLSDIHLMVAKLDDDLSDEQKSETKENVIEGLRENPELMKLDDDTFMATIKFDDEFVSYVKEQTLISAVVDAYTAEREKILEDVKERLTYELGKRYMTAYDGVIDLILKDVITFYVSDGYIRDVLKWNGSID